MIYHRSDNESCESSDTKDLDVDFEQPVNQVEEEEDEDWGLLPDLRRIVQREEREIKSHQEETKVRDELVALLWDYQDIFAWSY